MSIPRARRYPMRPMSRKWVIDIDIKPAVAWLKAYREQHKVDPDPNPNTETTGQ